jgi:hypothetical protein
MQRGFNLWAGLIVGVLFCAQGAWAATYTEDFSSLPSDPVWKGGENGWLYSTDVNSSGSTSNTAMGSIQSGGPAGKFGSFTGVEDGAAIVSNPNTLTGTWSFLMRINQTPVDARPGDAFHSGQTGFVLGTATHLNGGPAQARPDLLFDTMDDGTLRFQFQSAPGVFQDKRVLAVDTWYRYDFSYDYSVNKDWDVVIRNLAGTAVFDEPGVYQGSNTYSTLPFAHWFKRSDAGDAALSPNFDLDQVNLGVPEPTSAAALLALGAVFGRRRRRAARG